MCILHVVFCTVCKYVLSICKLLLLFCTVCPYVNCKLFVVFFALCYIQPVPGYVTEREDHADYLILKKRYLLQINNEQHKVNKVSINV